MPKFIQNETVRIVRHFWQWGWATVGDKQPEQSIRRELMDRSDPVSRILDLADDAIITIDQHHRIVLFNRGAERMFGYAVEEALAEPLEILLPPTAAQFHRSHIETFGNSGVVARRMGERRTIRGRRKDGAEFPAEASISKVMIHGEVTFTVIMRDVTERTILDERLKASLREKEALLQEVHHRVKNNLQVVSSLLGLQSRTISDVAVRKAFEESRDRIQSMALLHECLYQSDDLAGIDFAEYLPRLSNQLIASYGVKDRVRLDARIEHLKIGMDLAVPCGLIVNELVSNSLKYAFPDGGRGTVLLSLRQQTEGMTELRVADDGVGLPAEIEWKETKSLGLRLVRILALQLQASVTMQRSGGTSFAIVFRSGQPINAEMEY